MQLSKTKKALAGSNVFNMPKIRKRLEKANVSACNEFVIGKNLPNNDQNSQTTGCTTSPNTLPGNNLSGDMGNAVQLNQTTPAPKPGSITQHSDKSKNELGRKATGGTTSLDSLPVDDPQGMRLKSAVHLNYTTPVPNNGSTTQNLDTPKSKLDKNSIQVKKTTSKPRLNDGTPYKSNGRQLYNKAPEPSQAEKISASIASKREVICCDYLELTVRNTIKRLEPGEEIPMEITMPGVRLVTASRDSKGNKIIAGTKHFRAKYHVFLKNEPKPFATIITYPRKGGILPDYLSQIKVENRELYTEGWTVRLIQLLSALRVEVNNVSRLDIAIDSNCTGADPFLGLYYTSPFIGLFKRWKSGLVENVGRATYNQEHAKGREATGFDWGKESSSKHLTAYVKSDTLEKDGKSYIKDFWRLNGVPDGRVERLELKLKADAMKRKVNPDDALVGVNIRDLDKSEYLAGIMKVHLKGWFEFVIDQPDKNKTRRDNYETIDWDNLSAKYLERIPTTKPRNEIWAAKRAITKGLCDAGTEYAKEAAKTAIADAIASHSVVCGTVAEQVVKEHLEQIFPYVIPEYYFNGLGVKLARAIGDEIGRAIDDHSAKMFNVGIYSSMAKAHKLEDFFNKKALMYGL